MRTLILFLLTYAVVLLQSSVIPVFVSRSYLVNLFVIFTVNISFFRRGAELLFWVGMLGFLIDSLSAFPLGFNIVLLPALALLAKYLLRRFWGKPSLFAAVSLTGFLLVLYDLAIFLARLLLAKIPGLAANSIPVSSYAISTILWAIIINCFLITPLFYAILKILNELFEYWEQKRKL